MDKAPYVGNGCRQRTKCQLIKYFYEANVADKNYWKRLTESRSGLAIQEEKLKQLDQFLSPLIQMNQSIHHICVNNPDRLMWSEKTIYKYSNTGCLKTRNIDLPRKVRYHSRVKSKPLKIDKDCRVGRTYADYQRFVQEYLDFPVVEWI